MLVTDFQRLTYVPACIKLMHARVIQFETLTLRALTIMLEVEGAMEVV